MKQTRETEIDMEHTPGQFINFNNYFKKESEDIPSPK